MRSKHRLFIYEAIAILQKMPAINGQVDNFIIPLKLFSRGTFDTTNTN